MPSSRNYTFSGMAPLFTVRRGETVLLQIDQTQTVNGSLFSVVGDSVVLQLKKGDAALLDGPTPDTDAEALFYDVTLTDQTGFENWIVGGPFTLLGLNDVSCGGCNEKVEVTLGGQCIQINIEGGNLGIGASVNLAALNQAVQDAEEAAEESSQSASLAASSASQSADSASAAQQAAEDAQEAAYAALYSLPETTVQAASMSFPASIMRIRTSGNSVVNDGGGALYKRTTSAEVLNKIYPTPASSVLAYLPLNGIPGQNVFYDLSTSARPISSFGQVVSSNEKLLGQYSAYFDGVGDRVDIGGAPPSWSGDFTIDMWAKFEDLASVRLLFAHQNNTTNYMQLTALTDGSVRFEIREANTAWVDLVSPAAVVALGQFYHVAVVRLGDEWSLYVNRLRVATVTTAYTVLTLVNSPRVGSGIAGNMKGWISRFRLQNVAMWSNGYKVGPGEFGVPAQVPGPPWPWTNYDLMPTEAYFRSADGAFWVLDEMEANPFMFGAVGGADMVAVSGVDDGPSLRALNSYMAVSGAMGKILGYHFCVDELTLTASSPIRGIGQDRCGIAVAMNAWSTGIRILGNGSGVTDILSSVRAYEARGGGRGDRQCNVTVGDQKFTNGTPVYVDDFLIDNVTMHKAASGPTASGGVFIMHSCRGGRIGTIKDHGSPRRHTFGLMVHWGARGEGDGYGITRSHHNNRFSVDTIDLKRTDQALVVSSPFACRFERVIADACTQALMMFVGDETNAYAGPEATEVLKGIEFGSFFISNPISGRETNLFTFTSLGSSTFRRFPPPDEAVGRLRVQVPVWVTIEKIDVCGTSAADKSILDFFVFNGNARIGSVTYAGYAGRPVSINRSQGIQIDRLRGDSTSSDAHLSIIRSSDVTVNARLEKATTTGTGLYLAGEVEAYTLGASASAGATTIQLTTPLTQSVQAGQILRIGVSAFVRATAYRGAGCVSLPVTPLTADAAAGDPVVSDQTCNNINIDLKTVGFEYGVDVIRAKASLSGFGPEGAGSVGYRFRSGADVTLLSPSTRNNGGSGGSDIEVQVGARVRQFGGFLGMDGPVGNYNVRVPTSDPDADRRYMAFGVTFLNTNPANYITGSSTTDYLLSNCVGPTGTIIT